MMNWYGYSWNMPQGMFGLIGPILMILFWGATIWAIIYVIRGGRGGYGRMGKTASIDILKERYAKGEIDKKEFEEKKQDLG